MALLLSSKLVRCLATIARGRCILFRGHTYAYRRRTYFEIRDLVRNFSASSFSEDSKLDRSLRRLDQDVRRVGRVSRRELDDVLEELRISRSATTTQSLLIIRCCGSLLPEEPPEHRTQLVEEIWKLLNNLGVPMDISHYNALLRVYLENEYSFSPTEFLADLERKGIEPNRVTYQRLVERYCQGGDIDGATHILEFMRAKQLPVNEYIFNSLILGHSQAGDMKSAADILNVMKHAGLEPSNETYTTLLSGYAKYGDISSLRKVLEQCSKEDIHLVDQDYMEIVYALAINDHHEHIDEIIEKFQNTAGFNQDAFNLILKLTNKRKFDVAKKILFTMSRGARDGQLLPSGNFFIKQLIKANCPIKETLLLCEELQQEGLNDRSFLIATETCLSEGNVENAYTLLLTLKAKGYSIKEHYFWPLIISHGKTGNSEGILAVLKTMSEKFQITVSEETMRDYVVPWLSKHTPKNSNDDIISILRAANVTVESAAVSLVHHLLSQNDIKNALHIAREYRVTCHPSILRKSLLQAYQKTRDAESFAGMLHAMFISTESIGMAAVNSNDSEESIQYFDRFEMVGQMLLDAVSFMKGDISSDLTTLLKAMYKEGMGISNSVAERLVERLASNILTTEISDLLEKLTSGETLRQSFKSSSQRSSAGRESHLRSLMKNLNAKGDSSLNVKKQLLSLYCKNRELQKADEIWKELQNDGVTVGPGLTAQLIDLYVSNEYLEKALDLLNHSQKISDFVLDKVKSVKLACLIVKRGSFEDAMNFLQNHSQLQRTEENTYILGSACRQLLNYLADEGQIGNLKNMLNFFFEHGYVEVNNNILGPLIKVHLARNDLDGAVKEFEECCHKYHCTPLKNELTCKLIQAEDAVSLQKLTDLSTKVHGEVNSLYDLVFAFVECGRIRQARKILETPGLLSRPQRVQSACRRYSQEGMISSLEGLVEATKSLPHVDPSDIYLHLLRIYCKQNDTENAMGLWIKMQEENLQPTNEFLVFLGNHLKRKGLAVPFVVPVQIQNVKDKNQGTENLLTHKFMSAVETNVPEALQILESMDDNSKRQISKSVYSSLLSNLIKSEREDEAITLLLHMLKLNVLPSKQILEDVVKKIVSSGDVKMLQQMDEYLNESTKKYISLSNKLCQAYIVNGRASEYLDILEKELDECNDLKKLSEKVPKNSLLILLKQHPELHPQFHNICEKFFKRGSIILFNIMWMHYASEHEYTIADNIWNQYLSSSQEVIFHRVSRSARDKLDLPLANYVVDRLKQSSVENVDHGFAYSCLVDILLSSEKFSEALKIVNECKGSVTYQRFSRTTLERLQTVATEQGLTLEIPQKTGERREEKMH